MLITKIKLSKGFTMVELMISIIIATVIVGGLIYVVGESNFYLTKQMYRENVKKYADNVLNDIFLSAINANEVNIENDGQILCGFKKTDSLVDSLKVYDYRINQGILVDGRPLENAFFHNKDKNKNYYMQIVKFKAKSAFDGIGVNADLRDAVVDVFLGIQLNYRRGEKQITESFPFQKTIFTRKAAVYSSE
ncbi:prepilin-type N-terminal cleavage/methylation domain-containing protein [bacterium]|nr:MAG: prepilin-type N-terminal cleavage/methylation domain-containing protein [bacterium]